MSYDFSNLTERQQELLTYQGWHPGDFIVPQPSPRTVKKLIERGLLIEGTVREAAGPLTITVKTYAVPTAVHMAWCAHCATKEKAL